MMINKKHPPVRHESVRFFPKLTAHVQFLYSEGLKELVSGRALIRNGINCYTDHAGPAYMIACAAIEAFLNEMLYSSRIFRPDVPFFGKADEWAEKIGLVDRVIRVPEFLYGKTFIKGKQPLQDFTLLVKLRNYFVHYKMEDDLQGIISELEKRKIALTPKPFHGHPQTPFYKLCSSEGIRWANNTTSKVANGLFQFMPKAQKQLFGDISEYFQEIPELVPQKLLKDKGVVS